MLDADHGGLSRPVDRLGTGQVLLFCLLAGTAGTFAHGYYFGLINHVGQLPQLFRLLDAGYLARDFAVNSASGYGPRFFYLHLLVPLARLFPLPAVFLVLTCLQNAALGLVTYVVARRMFDQSDLAGMIACSLVLGVRSVQLGMADFLVLPALIPSSLVMGLSLLALWQGIRNRPLLCAGLSLPVLLIHPLAGLLVGGIGLGTSAVSGLFGIGAIGSLRSAERRRLLVRTLAGFAVLAASAALVWVLPLRGERLLSSAGFVDIYARFRNPHHVMPGTFRPVDYAAMAAFLVATGLMWYRWYRDRAPDRNLAIRYLLPFGFVLLLWAGGYVFVEVLPSRFWATLQTFRLVYVVKWLGLLLLGGTVAGFLVSDAGGQRLVGSMLMAGTGIAQPFVMLWGSLVEEVRRRLRPRRSPTVMAVLLMLGILVGVVLLCLVGFSNREFLALLTFALLILVFLMLRRPATRLAAGTAVVAALVVLVLVNKHHPVRFLGGLLGKTQPVFSLGEVRGPEDGVAGFVRECIPEDAIFLVPPRFGRFRLTARRAIVIDFKGFLVTDRGMLEWRQRLLDCYGAVAARGFRAADEMDRNYRGITDERIRMAAGKYGADHAVLYRETTSGFPVLYRNSKYKVVSIAPAVAMVVFRESPEPVADPGSYFRMLVEQQYPGYAIGTTYVIPVDSQVTTRVAAERYRKAVADGDLPELAGRMTSRRMRGPEGKRLTVLFFVAGPETR